MAAMRGSLITGQIFLLNTMIVIIYQNGRNRTSIQQSGALLSVTDMDWRWQATREAIVMVVFENGTVT